METLTVQSRPYYRAIMRLLGQDSLAIIRYHWKPTLIRLPEWCRLLSH